MRNAVVSAALAALSLTGCYQTHGDAVPRGDTVRLQVWARGDLPARSVTRARIAIGDIDRSISLPDDGIPLEPILLLEVEIEPGEYTLDATLFSPRGVVVATQSVAVRVFADQSVTLVFDVGCLDVLCAPGEECFEGECVDECERFPERCAPCTCESDADCNVLGPGCATGRCLDCQCVIVPDSSLCTPGAFCNDAFECVFEPSPMCECDGDTSCGGPVAGTCLFEVCDCRCFPGEGMCETGTVCNPNTVVCAEPDHPLDIALIGRVDEPAMLRRYRVFVNEVLRFRGEITAAELDSGRTFEGLALPEGEYEVRIELLRFDYTTIAERSGVAALDAPTLLRMQFF